MSGKPKPVKPKHLDAPGLIYRPRQSGWLLMWSPRSELVARGYEGKTYRLWPPSAANPHPAEPTLEEWEGIAAWCQRYRAEMLLWANGGLPADAASVFDGTIGSLIKLYQTDPDSPFRKLRYQVRLDYGYRLAALAAAVGSVRISDLTFRDFLRWYEKFAAPRAPGEREQLSSAHDMMKKLRLVLAFGALALPKSSGCADVHGIIARLSKDEKFSRGSSQRIPYLHYQQAAAICAEAHRRGMHSIALAQAFMIECGLRQKDMVGEWVPHSEPGVSDTVTGKCKWLFGARWEEIDQNFIWTHRLSKSVKGNQNIMRAEVGKTEEFDLRSYPMVIAELCQNRAQNTLALMRDDFPASGPLIICEMTGRPWINTYFSRKWREIARACGIPDEVQNRDSRAGAATEAELAGAPTDKVQRLLGHSRPETTRIYERGSREIRNQIAALRAEKRK